MFAYVGCRTTRERNARGHGLGVYRLDDAAGAWSRIQIIGDLVNPSYLTFGRAGRVLYVVHGDSFEVSAFRVDAGNGTLTFLNRQSTQGRNPVHLAVDPTNRFLVVANYATGSLASLPISEDGSLEPVCHLLELTGEQGPHRSGQTCSHPHQVLSDPSGSCFIVPDKGVDTTFIIGLNGESGRLHLDEARRSASRPGAGPRHSVFHPDASILYVVNELDSTVTTFRYHSETQTLQPIEVISTLPAHFFGANSGAAIAILPSGRFVYVSNRGHDSVAIFAVDPQKFTLRPAGWTGTLGDVPRFMTLDSSGQMLFVANEASDTIVAFQVDPTSGALTPTGHIVETGSPVCVLFSQATA